MKGPGGQMGKLLKQAQKMQAQMARAQEEIQTMEVEASAGGGAVIVKVNGAGELVSLKIDPAAVDPGDVETLEDLILVAINQALRDIKSKSEEKLAQVAGPMSGMMGF